MPIRINFDQSRIPQLPTFVLTNRAGVFKGAIPAFDIVVKPTMSSGVDLVFCVHKELNGKKIDIWDQIEDFKLAYCPEWDAFFEIYVELKDSDSVVKNITAKSLGEAELSQVLLYGIEINTEADILREDYSPTQIYNASDSSASLLDRIMEKAPHYKIKHVDASIARLQRTFTFDSKSIYDAFQEISAEINCIFVISCGLAENGGITREISVYDLDSCCLDCRNRGSFLDVCPECGGTNILQGYGDDTTICASVDNLADEIIYKTDAGSVKNCFKLIAGDDLMTATIANCNPNGTGYIWYIPDSTKADMSDELVAKLASYDEQYDYYQNRHVTTLTGSKLQQYNALVAKYSSYENNYPIIPERIVGYPALMNAYYDTIDFYLYLKHGMMPEIPIESVSASSQAKLLTKGNIPSISVQNLSTCSSATVSNAALSFAKIFTKKGYSLRVNDGTFNANNTWTGNFLVSSYSNPDDSAISSTITIPVNDDAKQFLGQKLKKELFKSADENTDIIGFFDLESQEFANDAKLYCLERLISFRDACQACLNILIEHGAGNNKGQNSELYSGLYSPYHSRLKILESEIAVRESELAIIASETDSKTFSTGIQDEIMSKRNEIQDVLDFQKYLGNDLWLEFSAYRRDDSFQNENYISDGLDNAELFNNALEFINVAKKEIFKSATLQHSITANLKNLLAMKEFAPLVDYFEVGNWIRIIVDGELFRLRLIDFEINYNDLESISTSFSDVRILADGVSDVESILSKAASMATSYGYVAKQAEKGKNGNDTLSNWVAEGLDLTNIKIMSEADNQTMVYDKYGMLFREYDSISETYDPCQIKIINSTFAMTDDDWNTVKTALGKYYYVDPVTQEVKVAFGLNAETIVGKFVLGEYLGMHNEAGSMTFDGHGLSVTNGKNHFRVDPDPEDNILFAVSNSDKDILYIDEDGLVTLDSSYVTFENSDSSTGTQMSFSADGLSVSNSTNAFYVNPNQNRLVRLSRGSADIFYVDEYGNLHVEGNITGTISGLGTDLDIGNNSSVTDLNLGLSDTKQEVETNKNQIGENIERINGIESIVDNLEDSYSSIVQKYNNIELSVSSTKKDVSNLTNEITGIKRNYATITIVDNKISSEVAEINETIDGVSKQTSVIEQKVNSISLSVTNNETSSSIVLTAGDQTIGSGTIEMTGLVKFKSLQTAGETIINADNISTGTINANLIKAGTLDASILKLASTSGGFSVATGNDGVSNTVGAKMYGSLGESANYYVMVTNSGAIMRAGSGMFYVTDENISASKSITTGSDIRIKHSINYDMDKYEAFYENLKPVSFKYNSGTQNTHMGFVAQEVYSAMQDAGFEKDDFAGLYIPSKEDGMYQIAYSEFIALNTHMIHKLLDRVKQIEERLS